MSKGFVGALSILLAGAGLAFAQAPPPAPSSGPASTTTPGQPATAPIVIDAPRSPYWPVCTGLVEHGAAPNGNRAGCANCAADEPVGECVWTSAEYLVWWMRSGPSPIPLATTSGIGSLGILGNPDTHILLGTTDIQYRATSGGRFTLGAWLDPAQRWGLEGSGFFFERRTVNAVASSGINGTPIIARPFINAINGAESSVLVSSPGQFAGSVSQGSTNLLYGMEANLVRGSLYNDRELRVEAIAGFRYVHLEEELSVLQDSQLLPGGSIGFLGTVIFAPGRVSLLDSFIALNDFYGGQVGARADYHSGAWSIDARVKLALGSTHEVVRIAGGSQFNNPSGTQSSTGGLLALSTNTGRLANDTFAVIPELGFNVGYQVCPHVKLFGGYTFLYWSDVVRPGDHLSRTINPALIPISQAFGLGVGPAQPTATLQRSDFWAQGLNFGVAFSY